jgi:hypothetical protein
MASANSCEKLKTQCPDAEKFKREDSYCMASFRLKYAKNQNSNSLFIKQSADALKCPCKAMINSLDQAGIWQHTTDVDSNPLQRSVGSILTKALIP